MVEMSEKEAGAGDGQGPQWEAPPWLRTLLWVGVGLLGVVGLFFLFRPQPVAVDLVTVERGTLEVVVDEDGRTRVRDRFQIRSPVGGTLLRPQVEVGDLVAEGDELLRIEGPEATLDDARTRAQLRTRLEAARAGVERARSMAEAAEAGLVEAREELRRQELLLREGGGSSSAVERAAALLRAREAEVRSAGFGVRAAQGEVEELELQLTRPPAADVGVLVLTAPVAGQVLRLHRESGGPVSPAEPLLELGDPGAMEMVVDVLSADAVGIPTGARARISGWGGETLEARVRRVEPSGFTRVSALGIEEQRVNVILDPDGEGWGRLGDGFRIEATILVEEAQDVLWVPTGAAFRRGDGWAVFRAGNGRLEEVPVEVGRRSQAQVEIVSGLSEGDRVVLYPGDRVEDGVRYRERE
jgi:HlyD family secretion protein